VKRLLITGIPGTGKTTFGGYLHNAEGYTHVDVEAETNRARSYEILGPLVQRVCNTPGDVVVTWGFRAREDRQHIEFLRSMGFSMVWLDGDRNVALKYFKKRGTVPEFAFWAQVQDIDQSGVVTALQPYVFDPFTSNGNFKPSAQFYQKILSRIKRSDES
jgi:shikimate kinase